MRGARRATLFGVAFFAPAVCVWSCGLDAIGRYRANTLLPDEDTGPETSPSELDANRDADGSIEAARCPTVGDASMLLVEHEAGSFCIDPTEVTNAAFNAFLVATGGGRVDAGVPEAGLPSGCAAVQSFAPIADSGSPSQPVAFVTWCTAYAYCAWAGKRLCKGVVNEPSRGDWAIACTRDGTRTYPYGATYDGGACNDRGTGTVPVGSMAGCQGGFDGVFDMTGNVAEFIDVCNAQLTLCSSAGGSYLTGTANACSIRDGWNPAASTAPDLGFRCCADKR